ncbi:hypothetical protein IFM89_024052 [Coptis chinensis]|uniref:DNA recombination and repair protein Rad51-like C-terminal domain-containing protein n=1 Tax=Coptis chinensis TaxID=261450 RepID=A0A835HF72_9MAGN|nr:hypothetical protein IFM89_024052 [Coptis chinensis]
MPSLKSLETEHPIINPNFQQFCASHSIFTVEDFLITDMELLTAFAEKHSTSNQLKLVCLQTASSVACKYVDSVVFLDTCNSFTSRRVACFVDRLLNSSFNQATKNGVERAMNNIVCHSVFDIFGLLDVLNHLEFTLRSQGKTGGGKLRLLVIDSISSLITPVLGGGGAHVAL